MRSSLCCRCGTGSSDRRFNGVTPELVRHLLVALPLRPGAPVSSRRVLTGIHAAGVHGLQEAGMVAAYRSPGTNKINLRTPGPFCCRCIDAFVWDVGCCRNRRTAPVEAAWSAVRVEGGSDQQFNGSPQVLDRIWFADSSLPDCPGIHHSPFPPEVRQHPQPRPDCQAKPNADQGNRT